jgi:hypothetical protein
LFQFEGKIGGHTEEAWCYQFEVFVKHFYWRIFDIAVC